MLRHLLRLLWLAILAGAFALFGLAWLSFSHWQQTELEKAEARAGGVPEAVSLSAFRRDLHESTLGEVHVTGRVNPAYTSVLGDDPATAPQMYVMFAASDAVQARVARAAVLLDADEAQAFVAKMMGSAQSGGELGLVFPVNGATNLDADLVALADAALERQGLLKSRDFVFIQPWSGRRDAAFAPAELTELYRPGIYAGVGLLFLLVSLLGLRLSKRPEVKKIEKKSRKARRAKKDKPEVAETPAQEDLPASTRPTRMPVPVPAPVSEEGQESDPGDVPPLAAEAEVPSQPEAAARAETPHESDSLAEPPSSEHIPVDVAPRRPVKPIDPPRPRVPKSERRDEAARSTAPTPRPAVKPGENPLHAVFGHRTPPPPKPVAKPPGDRQKAPNAFSFKRSLSEKRDQLRATPAGSVPDVDSRDD